MKPKFSGFNREEVINGINQRVAQPSLIDQNGTNLCGIAVIGFLFAQQQPEVYRKAVIDLYESGKARVNNFEIRANPSLYEMSKTHPHYPIDVDRIVMNPADYILLTSIKHSQNIVIPYTFGIIEALSAVTAPSTIKKLMIRMLSFSEVITNTSLLFSKGGIKELYELERQFQQGRKIVMMINSRMLYKKAFGGTVPSHFVVYLGGLKIIKEGTTAQFKVYNWGKIVWVTVSAEVFKANYFGVISGK